MTDRYIVTLDDINHACCNEASVADTTKPNEYNKCGFQTICECPYESDAKWIATALNREHTNGHSV